MNKEINSKIATFVFLLVVSVLIIFLNGFGYLNGVKNSVLYIAVPTQGIFQTSLVGVSDFFQTIESISKFKEENAILRNENLKLTYEISELKETKRENEILKQQLDFSDNLCLNGSCFQWKMGRIIGRDPSNYGKYIIINLGAKNRVKENQAVIISGGILIGKVIEVFDNSSKVMLITSPDSSINSIAQTTRANGIAKGKYATGVKLEMIDQSEELILGDLIITSGLESKIPKGLIIGKVSNIEESANKVFKVADLDLFANFNQIEEIFIIKDYDQ